MHRLTVNACLDVTRKRRRRAIEVELTHIEPVVAPDESVMTPDESVAVASGPRWSAASTC